MTLRVAVDARVRPGAVGGIAQAAAAIVRALGELDGPEQYAVVVDSDDGRAFIEPHLGENQRLVQVSTRPRSLVERAMGRLRPADRAPGVPESNGLYESLADVVHFPHQTFVRTALPMIYNPWDLQHLHYPEFFSEETLAWRELVYPEGCRLAHTVAAASRWIADDLIAQFRLAPDKIQVIPMGPPTAGHAAPSDNNLAAVRGKWRLPDRFYLYPAVPWPHKNHVALVEALARARDAEGLELHLVCTGSTEAAGYETALEAVRRHALERQVRFLGFVSELELRALYRMAAALVMPSLHESDSFPIFEAWHEGLPVLSSNVTSLPAQVGDAAILFEPTASGIADALVRFERTPGLATGLRERGTLRLADFSWERTARAYRAVYRRAAGRRLDEEDEQVLARDWMLFPS